VPGPLNVIHKKRYLDDYSRHAEIMATRFGYPHISFMDATETAERLGSTAYSAATATPAPGHIHPLKLVVGTARVAAEAGAHLFMRRRRAPDRVARRQGRGDDADGHDHRRQGPARGQRLWRRPRTGQRGARHADRLLHRRDRAARRRQPGASRRRVGRRFALRRALLPQVEGRRLLFGGREIYAVNDPKDIHIHIRRQIAEIYPALKDVEITHGWGGYVGITMPRKPFVREVMPNVISAGGYSGHGVMLSNFVGKLYAETVAGNRDRLKLFEDLKIPAFPGGRRSARRCCSWRSTGTRCATPAAFRCPGRRAGR
jgi:gamma-glutamylputrescine oxidase